MSILNKAEQHLSLMSEMFQKTGVWDHSSIGMTDEAQLQGAILRCIGCRKAGDCRSFLDSHEKVETVPDFCLNKTFIEGVN